MPVPVPVPRPVTVTVNPGRGRGRLDVAVYAQAAGIISSCDVNRDLNLKTHTGTGTRSPQALTMSESRPSFLDVASELARPRQPGPCPRRGRARARRPRWGRGGHATSLTHNPYVWDALLLRGGKRRAGVGATRRVGTAREETIFPPRDKTLSPPQRRPSRGRTTLSLGRDRQSSFSRQKKIPTVFLEEDSHRIFPCARQQHPGSKHPCSKRSSHGLARQGRCA